MRSYQYILLDWDGNLARTLDVWLWACRQVLEPFGQKLVSREDIHSNFYEPIRFYTERQLPNPVELNHQREKLAIERLPEAELYPDALEVLSHLEKAGKHLALVSSSPRVAIDNALQRLELTRTFKVVISGNDITHHKPHPEPLEKALAALGGAKSETIMIGDAAVDIQSANEFGIDSIAFMPPEHKQYYNFEDLLAQKPTYNVSDFRAIMELIQ